MVKICSIEGCGKPKIARGWCAAHYELWRRHGEPKTQSRDGAQWGEAQRFYNEVVLTDERGPDDPCLIWPFGCGGHGYAQMNVGGVCTLVHRRVCEEVNGEPPTPEHEAAHSCNRGKFGCVTQGHLSWKTHIENMADQLVHGTRNRGARNGLAKLTEHDVREIRPLLGTMPLSAIGERFGVSGASIHQIESGKAWSWVA